MSIKYIKKDTKPHADLCRTLAEVVSLEISFQTNARRRHPNLQQQFIPLTAASIIIYLQPAFWDFQKY